MGKRSLSLWSGCVSETGGFPKIRKLGVLPGIGKTIAVRSGRRGDPLVAPVIVSDRLFLSGLLASMARLCFTGWEAS